MGSVTNKVTKFITAVQAAASLSSSAEKWGVSKTRAVVRGLLAAKRGAIAGDGRDDETQAVTVIIGCWEAAEGNLEKALDVVRSRALPSSVVFTGGDNFSPANDVGTGENAAATCKAERPGPVVAEAALAALTTVDRCYAHIAFQHTDHLHERSLYPSQTLFY